MLKYTGVTDRSLTEHDPADHPRLTDPVVTSSCNPRDPPVSFLAKPLK